MATQAGGVVQDQNLNIIYNGTSVPGKGNNATLGKGGLGGGLISRRKPLGDLSNSGKPILHQASKMKNSSFIEGETGGMKNHKKSDVIKMKSVSLKTSSERLQTSGAKTRKALSDISNSGKPSMNEVASRHQKKQSLKLSTAADEPPLHLSTISEEQFLHNHEECIKSQSWDLNMAQLLKTVGLDDVPKQLAASTSKVSIQNAKLPDSALRKNHVEFEEMDETFLVNEDRFTSKFELFGTSPACKTPKVLDHHNALRGEDSYSSINFKLIKTPNLPNF